MLPGLECSSRRKYLTSFTFLWLNIFISASQPILLVVEENSSISHTSPPFPGLCLCPKGLALDSQCHLATLALAEMQIALIVPWALFHASRWREPHWNNPCGPVWHQGPLCASLEFWRAHCLSLKPWPGWGLSAVSHVTTPSPGSCLLSRAQPVEWSVGPSLWCLTVSLLSVLVQLSFPSVFLV